MVVIRIRVVGWLIHEFQMANTQIAYCMRMPEGSCHVATKRYAREHTASLSYAPGCLCWNTSVLREKWLHRVIRCLSSRSHRWTVCA